MGGGRGREEKKTSSMSRSLKGLAFSFPMPPSSQLPLRLLPTRLELKGCQMGGAGGNMDVNTPNESAVNSIQIPSLLVFLVHHGYHQNDGCF